MLACINTIHTHHATAVVHRMLLAVNARSLALARTQTAGIALIRVNSDTQQGEAGKETEHRAYRTNSVAVCPSVPPRQSAYYNKGKCGDNKCRQTL